MSNPCPPVDSCACNSHCCIADAETHYGNTSFDNSKPVWVDTAANGTLATRTAIELYNDGTVDWQFSTVSGFQYGQGRTVKPNTGVALAIGPKTRHYVLCSSTGCSAHFTELGSASV